MSRLDPSLPPSSHPFPPPTPTLINHPSPPPFHSAIRQAADAARPQAVARLLQLAQAMPSDPPLSPGSAGTRYTPRWHLLKAHVMAGNPDAAWGVLQVGVWFVVGCGVWAESLTTFVAVAFPNPTLHYISSIHPPHLHTHNTPGRGPLPGIGQADAAALAKMLPPRGTRAGGGAGGHVGGGGPRGGGGREFVQFVSILVFFFGGGEILTGWCVILSHIHVYARTLHTGSSSL